MAASIITHLLYGFLGIYRDTEDVQKRVDILHGSKFDKLNPKQKEAIVRNPVAGQVYVHHYFFFLSTKIIFTFFHFCILAYVYSCWVCTFDCNGKSIYMYR